MTSFSDSSKEFADDDCKFDENGKKSPKSLQTL